MNWNPNIKLSEPKWVMGKGYREGESVPVYENGKYYIVKGRMCKYIEHCDGSGYLEHNPEYWNQIKINTKGIKTK
jgi:hypothetical protein